MNNNTEKLAKKLIKEAVNKFVNKFEAYFIDDVDSLNGTNIKRSFLKEFQKNADTFDKVYGTNSIKKVEEFLNPFFVFCSELDKLKGISEGFVEYELFKENNKKELNISLTVTLNLVVDKSRLESEFGERTAKSVEAYVGMETEKINKLISNFSTKSRFMKFKSSVSKPTRYSENYLDIDIVIECEGKNTL